jgi:hypothetical protein
MAAWSGSAAKATEQRERRVFWLTIAATMSTVLLGMTVAALITNRLSRPVRSLAIAMRDVRKATSTYNYRSFPLMSGATD